MFFECLLSHDMSVPTLFYAVVTPTLDVSMVVMLVLIVAII
jgi:hypothetical protein